MIRQVVVDFGGVLVEWNPSKIVESFTADTSLQTTILIEILQHSDWLELDRGVFTEAEAVSKIVARSYLSKEIVFSVFNTVRQSFITNEKMLRVLKNLVDQGLPCYGLSNMSVENYVSGKLTPSY